MAKEYVVKSGDTLSAIARDHKTDVKTLTQINSIQNSNQISVGQKIVLPGDSYSEAVAAAKSKLESGVTWGTAWWNVKNAVPDADNAQIDKDLNKDYWSKPGAYEKFTTEKKEPFSLDLQTDAGIAQTTPAIIPREPVTPEPDVTIVDPFKAEDEVKVDIVEPPTLDKKVEIIDIDKTPGKVTIVPEPPKPTGEPIRAQKPEDKPLRAFFNKFIDVDNAFKSGEEGASEEAAKYLRDQTIPIINRVIPWAKIAETAIFEAVPTFWNKLIGDKWYEGNIIIGKDLLNQEMRRKKTPEEERKRITDELFSISGEQIDLSQLDPRSFYQDASGQVLVPADIVSMTELGKGTQFQKEERKKQIELATKRDSFDDNVFDLEQYSRQMESDIGIIITGQEDEKEYNQKFQDSLDGMVQKIYDDNNVDGGDLAEEAAKNAKGMSSNLQGMAEELQDDIDALLDFSFKDAPKNIVEKSNEGFFDLIKDTESFSQYVKSAKDFNDYNNTLTESVVDEKTAFDDAGKLESELAVLRTSGNEEFLEENLNYDKLTEAQRIAHSNYYYQNQKDIDRIFDISKELNDIYSWMKINQLKAQQALDKSAAIGRALENFNEDFTNLIGTREFGDLLSSFATETGKDTSALVNYMNEYNKNKRWFDENDNKIAAQAASYETRKAKALLEIGVAADTVDRYRREYNEKAVAVYDAGKELERLQKFDDIAYNKMKAEVNDTLNASRMLHPFKTWDLWKEHGAKEVIWEGVPKLITAMLETGIEGTKKVGLYQAFDSVYGADELVKDIQYVYETEQSSASLAHLAKDGLQLIKMIGGASDSAAEKVNSWMGDPSVYTPYLGKDGKIPASLATRFSTWALNWMADGQQQDPEMFYSMKTRYDQTTATLPPDPSDENKTYTLDEIMKLYGSINIQNASSLKYISPEALRRDLLAANKFGDQGIDPNKIPVGTQVVISLGAPNASESMKQKERERMWMAGDIAYDKFKTTKPSSIYDFVDRRERDKIIEISLMNDFPAKGISLNEIPVGTELIIPKYDHQPSFLSWMDPEKRLRLKTRRPYWHVFWDEVVANVGDPFNYLWVGTAYKIGDFIDYTGGATSRKLMEQARAKSPTGRISAGTAKIVGGMENLNMLASKGQSVADWTHGLSEILRLRPVSNPDLAKLPDQAPLLELLKPNVSLNDQASLATLSVIMTKLRGITLSKMLPSLQKKLIDMTDLDINAVNQTALVDVKKALFDMSEQYKVHKDTMKEAMTLFVDNYTQNRNTVMKEANEFVKPYKTMDDWLRDKGKAKPNQTKVFKDSIIKDYEDGLIRNKAELAWALEDPEGFYTDYFRTNKNVRVIDIAWEFMDRTGLSEARLRKLLETVPDLENIQVELERSFLDFEEAGRYFAIHHSEEYASLPNAGKVAFRELLQNPATGELVPDQSTFNKIRYELLERYPADKAAIIRGVNVVQDFKDRIDWVRKYEEGKVKLGDRPDDLVLMPVTKDNAVELRTVDVKTLPKNLKSSWGDDAFKVVPDPRDPKKSIFIADTNAYKKGGLPMIMTDYGSVVPSERLAYLYNEPVGRSQLSVQKTVFDNGKRIQDYVEVDSTGRPNSDRITYGDILNTAFMDKKVGWFNTYRFKDPKAFRSEFKNIMDRMIVNEKEEFLSRVSVKREAADRRSLVKSRPDANRMYDIYNKVGTRVANYLDIQKFYEMVEGLKRLYDADPTHSLYRQLHDKLFVIKSQMLENRTSFPLTPTEEMFLLLMDIKGKRSRPDFLDSYPLIKGLLTDNKFSTEEMKKISSKFKYASQRMVRNKTDAKITQQASDMTAAQVNTMKSEVKKTVEYWDGEYTKPDEFAEKLKEEMALVNKNLPEDKAEVLSTQDLKNFEKPFEDTDNYYVGAVIPKLFTYITRERIGKNALLDNIVKFSKDINSKAVATVADITKEGRSYILKVVNDVRKMTRKDIDNHILFPTTNVPDSRILVSAGHALSKNYGFNNDLVVNVKVNKTIKEVNRIGDEILAAEKKLDDLLTPGEKKTRAKLDASIEVKNRRRDAIKKEIEKLEGVDPLSGSKKTIGGEIAMLQNKLKALVPEEIKNQVRHIQKEGVIPGKWLGWENDELIKLRAQLVYQSKLSIRNPGNKEFVNNIANLKKKIADVELKRIKYLGEFNNIQTRINKLIPETPEANAIKKEIVTKMDTVENLRKEASDIDEGITDIRRQTESLVDKEESMVRRDTLLYERDSLRKEMASIRGENIMSQEQNVNSLKKDLELARQKNASDDAIDKIKDKLGQAEARLKRLKDEEELYYFKEHDVEVAPGEDITIEHADGTTQVLKNTEARVTSPHKLLRNEIERRAKFEPNTLYGHLLKLERELSKKTDKSYIELPEGFLNDVSAVNAALELSKLEKTGVYDNKYFANRKVLDKLYKLEMDLALKQKAMTKQKNLIKKLKDNQKVLREKKATNEQLRNMSSKIKTEEIKLKPLVESFNDAADVGDIYANNVQIGKYNFDRKRYGMYERYNPRFNKIDYNEYPTGKTIITKEAIDWFNQVKSPKIKNDKGVLVDNPDYGKTVLIDDYTDYGKGMVEFLRDNPNHFVENRDYKVAHVKDAVDNEITTAQAVEAIKDSNVRPAMDMLNSDYGLGISYNDLMIMMNMSFDFDLPDFEKDRLYRKNNWNAFERFMTPEEVTKLERFANKLQAVYLNKSEFPEADKRRKYIWDKTVTGKYEPRSVPQDTDFMDQKKFVKARKNVQQIADDFDPDNMDPEDYEKLTNSLHDEAAILDELARANPYDPDRPRDIQDVIDRLDGNEAYEGIDYSTEIPQILEERKMEFALQIAGELKMLQKQLGWADLAPAETKGKWIINSVDNNYTTANMQTSLLQRTNGQFFDNGNLLPSVKVALDKEIKKFNNNTREFFEALPEIYGAKNAKSYEDFQRMHRRTVDDANTVLDYFLKRRNEMRVDHLRNTLYLRKILQKTDDVVNRLTNELSVERTINGKKYPGLINEVQQALGKLDKDNKYHLLGEVQVYKKLKSRGPVRRRTSEELRRIAKDLNVDDVMMKKVADKLNRADELKSRLKSLRDTKAEFELDLKNKDRIYNRSIELIESDIEKTKTKAKVATTIDNILAGTYKPKEKGVIEVREFSKEFVNAINSRLMGIDRQKRRIRNKISSVRKYGGEHPLVRRYLVELADLDREAVRLKQLVKFSVEWNVAAANKIKFTSKEIYNASIHRYTESYISKMNMLNKIMARDVKKRLPVAMLKAQKKLDVFFPEVKLGAGSTVIKELDLNWYKDWYMNVERKHPGEITLPRVDARDLADIDLKDSLAAKAKLIDFFEKTKGQARYPTIVDLTGELDQFIKRHLADPDADWSNKVNIINEKTFKDDIKSIIRGRGTHVSQGELDALARLKHLFEYRQGVWLFGKNKNGITAGRLADSFKNKALSKQEVLALDEVRKLHQQKANKFLARNEIKSLPQILSRSFKDDTMKLIGSDRKGIITKKMPKLNIEQIFRLANRFSNQVNILKRLKKERISFGEAFKMMDRTMTMKGKNIMVIGGRETLITDATRSAIDDALRLGVTFYFPKELQSAERSMMDYIREQILENKSSKKPIPNFGNIAKQRYDINARFKIGAKGTPGMVLFNNKKSLVNFKEKDRHMIYRKMLAEKFDKPDKKVLPSGEIIKKKPLYTEESFTEFRSFKELESEMERELSDELTKAWAQNPNRVAPQFVKEQVKFGTDIEEALGRWVALERKDDIHEDFKRISAENIKMYRNNEIEEKRMLYGRELNKWELDLIERNVRRAEQITDLINNYVFKFDMPDQVMSKIRNTVMDKVFYWSTLGSEDPNSKTFKAKFWENLQDTMKATGSMKDVAMHDVIGRLKTAWVWNVLLLKPSWYLWNNLGDSVRAIMGVRDIKLASSLQKGYLEANTKFINKIARQTVADPIAEALELGVRRTIRKFDPDNKLKLKGESLKEIRRNAENLAGITDAQLAELKRKISKIERTREYRVFKLEEEPTLPYGVASKKVDEILKFNFDANGRAITTAGEIIDQRTLEWITSSGLIQAVTDPIYARRIIESLPDKTFINRIVKRAHVLKGDVEMFASQLEQMRRQTMAFDMLFNKAYTLAQTEKIVKRYLFDYRDVTLAGRTFRILFPFYTFHAKSLQLYFSILLKAGPGPFQAGQALLEAMDRESDALPEYMKDRIELNFMGLKGIYFLPHFGIMDHFKMLLNPMEEFQNMTQNPMNAMFGLGFGPFPSSLIETVTGEGYFDRTHTTDQLKDIGWSMDEIADYKEKNKANKNADVDGFGNWLLTYSQALFPYVEVIKSLFAVDTKNTLRKTTFIQSKKVREIMKLFGINVIKMEENSLDEIAYVWHALNNLPPSLTNVYKKRLERENPELYKYFSDYAAQAWLKKINAMDDDELKMKEGISKIEAATVRKYYDMMTEKPGSEKVFLANDPIAKDVMERYWATKGDIETHEAGVLKFELGKMKSLVTHILDTLGTADAKRIRALNAFGIEHPFTKGFDKQKLYNDLYDMNGDLKIRSVEDLVAILEDHGVMKELAELMDTSKQSEKEYREYEKIPVDDKEAQRKADLQYYHARNIVNRVIPSNIDTMPEEEAAKYWTKWRQLKTELIDSNPEFKKKYEEDTPAWKRKYDEMNTVYSNKWVSLTKKNEEEGIGSYYKNFYEMPDWFQKRYFASHPERALYYPIISDYTDKIAAIRKKQEETGEWDAKAHADALNFLWGKQGALKAWDSQDKKAGVYNYIDKARQVWNKIAEDPTANYYDLFYQNPGDPAWNSYREYYLSRPENEYKKITYPFLRKWGNLRKRDEANDGDTNLAGDWFWLPKNEEARQLYGEHHPLEDGKNKLDYQILWKEYSPELTKDRGAIYKLVLDSPGWFKNEYWRNHPDRKLYYEHALKMQDMDFMEGKEYFFDSKNKEMREAWERDKPGTIATNEFWYDLGKVKDKDGNAAYLKLFFDPKYNEERLKYEKNNPGAHYAYKLWQMYEQLPTNSWLGRKKRRTFLRDNPELKDWWGRDKATTDEEKQVILKQEIYYTILDRVSAEGKGRQYYLDYYKAKAEAEQFVKDNPDLQKFWDSRDKKVDPITKVINDLKTEYFQLYLQEDKNEFLRKHPELNAYFQNNVPPGIKKVRELQSEYFDIEYDDKDKQYAERQKFLNEHPELTEYWDIKNLPTSYYTDKTKFEKYQTEFNKANDFFDAVKKGSWKDAEKLIGKLPSNPPDVRTEEGRWLLSKLYNEAMATWATTFGTYMSTYYFRSLPSWLRGEYYRRHPDAKIISYTPMSRSLNNAVTMENSAHPDLTWARSMMSKYGKDLPSSIDKQVQKIMVKWGEWENRSNWTSRQWAEWREARTARLNGLRAHDLQYLPLLRKELARAQKMFSYSMLPIRGGRKYGVINPFLGASVMLPELTVGIENDIIKTN